MIISFSPEYTFLSTGDKTAMYTLREYGLAMGVDMKGQRYEFMTTFYIQNLSTDKEKALAKGAEISANINLPFKANADFDLNEIKRKSREAAEQERADAEAYEQERRVKATQDYTNALGEGVMLAGKYTGDEVEKVGEQDVEYLQWFAGQAVDIDYYSKFHATAKIAAKWLEENPQPISEFQGEVGDTLIFSGIVTKALEMNGQFYTVLYRFKTATGNIITTFTTAKAFDEVQVGDELTISAKVKAHEHSPYELQDNDKVTVVARPKIINK